MAAYCPKCNYKLKITDWRPECPKCGVNIQYYGAEEILRQEADSAEYHYALRQPKFDRVKFSLIGHPITIARLVIGLLPIIATLLPMGKLSYVLPFGTTNASVNMVSIVSFIANYVKGFDFGSLGKFLGSEIIGKGMLFWAIAIVCLVLMILITLVGWFMLCLSASPRGFSRNMVFPILGITLATGSFVSYILMINALSASLPGIFSGTVNPLAYIAAVACFIALIVINIVYRKKGIQVKYKDVSEYLIPYEERPSTIAKKQARENKEAEEPAPANA